MKIDFSKYSGKKIKVGIIDSGFDFKLHNRPLQGGCLITKAKNNFTYSFLQNDLIDSIGHGNAITGIILNKAPDIELYVIRIFQHELVTDVANIIEAIRWCINNSINLVNLSLGTTNSDKIDQLFNICEVAYKKNIMLVSASNPNNQISYPAFFDNVFGVAPGFIKERYGFYYRENEDIQFIARGDSQRLWWSQPKYIFMGGSSFAAAHISGIIALLLEYNSKLTPKSVGQLLSLNSLIEKPEIFQVTDKSNFTISHILNRSAKNNQLIIKKDLRWIKKVLVYPFNKEMHSLVRFDNLLNFQIKTILDEPAKLNIGKDIGEILGISAKGLVVKSYKDIRKEIRKVDTIILGHLQEISRIKGYDVLEEIIKIAIENDKNVYSITPIDNSKYKKILELAKKKNIKIDFPFVNKELFDDLIIKKNFNTEITTPILGVFGTGPNQGKFTTQLAIRNELLKLGYLIGQIGTENQSELFEFDFTFPIGFGSGVEVIIEHYIPILRNVISELDTRNIDIIIAGAQSGIIPYSLDQSSNVFTLPSISYLFGINPDAVILIVNFFDDHEYINACIQSIKSLGKSPTILLIISDLTKSFLPSTLNKNFKDRRLGKMEIKNKIKDLERQFNIPVTEIVSQKGKLKLLNTVIDFFGKSDE